MKTNDPSEKNEPLSRILRQWSVDASLPPRFRENVWSRIEKAEVTPDFNFWTVLNRWVESILPRPKIAFSYVTALLLVGTIAGFWEAKAASDRADAAMSSRYVQTVDPYQTQ